MYDIDQALARILSSVYGKDVRSAIHDAIYEINEKADQSVDLSQIAFGTEVTDPTSPVEGFEEGKVYFNTSTGIIWRLSGGVWARQGSLRSINNILKTNTSKNVDTYTIFYSDDTTQSYTVTNGLQGISITDVVKNGTTASGADHYDILLSDGSKTPNGIDVANGISISDIEAGTTVGTTKNYKVKLSDGSYTPNGFSVSDGTSSYVHIRYSSSFDGQGMVVTPTESTVYIGIVVTTQSNAPTDPAVYSWVRFIGQSGSGSGDMLKADYATLYPNTVDKAAALYDGTREVSANQLMAKNDYATKNIANTVDRATELVDTVNSKVADTKVLADLTDDGTGLFYKGSSITTKLSSIDDKANASDVYTKSEVYTKTETDNKLDEWHTLNGSVEISSVTNANTNENVFFHNINTTLAYELFFENASGTQISLISSNLIDDSYSVLTGKTLHYIVNTPVAPTNFKLRVIK